MQPSYVELGKMSFMTFDALAELLGAPVRYGKEHIGDSVILFGYITLISVEFKCDNVRIWVRVHHA